MARLYSVFRSTGGDVEEDSSLVLDGTSRASKAVIDKTMKMIQIAGKGHYEWMPRKIVQATPRQAALVEKETHQMEIDSIVMQKRPSSPAALVDDEDLGVVV